MNILFIIPSYKPAYIYGGTTVVVSLLAEELVKQGHQVHIYTTTANGKEELPNVKAGETVTIYGVQVTYFKRITSDHTHLSPAMLSRLYKTAKDFDIVHLHSWWNLFNITAATLLAFLKKPYIISAHGMLSSYTFTNQNSTAKRLLHRYIGKRLLSNSTMHACTQQEFDEGRLIIPDWKGFIIPNLINIPKIDYSSYPKANSVFTLVFLSRVEQKKGLDNLIDVLPSINFNYHIKIAGDGEKSYATHLKERIQSLKLDEKFEWVGWLNKEKFDFLAAADLFILPSYNENFAVVVLEAIASGTPVLISNKVGLSDFVNQHRLGWVYDGSQRDLLEKLDIAYKDSEIKDHVKTNGLNFIKAYFDSTLLAQSYITEYNKLM